jgi:hypothetical protein
VKVTLLTPLQTHKGAINEIALKEPTALSFMNHGEPYQLQLDKDGNFVGITWHNDAMLKFLGDMTGLDQITLSGLNSRDYMRVRDRAFSVISGIGLGKNPTVPSETSPQS